MGAIILAMTPEGEPKPTPEEAAKISLKMLAGQDQKSLAAGVRGGPQLEVTAKQLEDWKVPMAFIYGSKEGSETSARIKLSRKYLKDAPATVIEGDHLNQLGRDEYHKAMLSFLRAYRER